MGTVRECATFENAGVQDVFSGLRHPKTLTREKALEAFRRGLVDASTPFGEQEVQAAIEEALSSKSWEAKQGALLAAAEALKARDSPSLRAVLLEHIPQCLVDSEYRVRKAVAPVLEECCRRAGVDIFDKLGAVVLGDIRDKFRRCVEEESTEEPEKHLEPPSFLPDTEGWHSLETSMGALQAMMQGCGDAFAPRISQEMLDLLTQCSQHTNRFVREYAFYAFKNTFEVSDRDYFLSTAGPATVDTIQAGLKDNWSQVRLAASTAVRAFMTKAGGEAERFFPKLLGNMCLNRHYVAEGVRAYSQDTWRQICGPQGGARLLVAHFDDVLDAFVEAAEVPIHDVREASSHCMCELASRVAGTPDAPTAHREYFIQPRVQRLLHTLVKLFEDEAWPVRDVASTALGHFVAAFPKDCEPFREMLVDLWFDQMADNIPSMRKNGAEALSMAVKTWTQLWPIVLHNLAETMPSVFEQEANSEGFTQILPTGLSANTRSKKTNVEDKSNTQLMSSYMSAAAKAARRRDRRNDGGCMNCAIDMPRQPWEASEGMVHLMAEMAALVAKGDFTDKEQKLDDLGALLPSLVAAFECDHYRQRHLFRQQVCERLPELSATLGIARMKIHLPKLVKIVNDCAARDKSPNLRESAQACLDAWHRTFGRGLLEDESRDTKEQQDQLLG